MIVGEHDEDRGGTCGLNPSGRVFLGRTIVPRSSD